MTPYDALALGVVAALAWSCRDLGWRAIALSLSLSVLVGVLFAAIARSHL